MRQLLAVWLLLLMGVFCLSKSDAAFWIGQTSTPAVVTSTVPQDASGWYDWHQAMGPGGFCEGTTACSTAGPLGTPAPVNMTQIFYVSTSGSNGNDGSFNNPFLTINTTPAHMRSGSPDWMLIKKGDIFTNDEPGTYNAKGGLDCAHPLLYASYDPGLHNQIPNPYTGGARPLMKLDSGQTDTGFGFSNTSYVAISGLNFYAWKRDPSTAAFLRSESQHQTNSGLVSAVSCFYFEDTGISYFEDGTGTTEASHYQPDASIFIHRNEIIANYPHGNSASNGIGTGVISNGPANFVVDGNVVDYNGFSFWDIYTADGGGIIAWAPPSGFNHNFYLNGTGNNGDPGGVFSGSRATVANNLISRDDGGEQWRGGGTITGNLGILEDELVTYFLPYSTAGNSITGNISISPFGYGVGITGMEIGNAYINENVKVGGTVILNNILSGSLFDPTGDGIDIYSGANGVTATGNILFNWANGAINTITAVTGSIYSATGLMTVSVPGTGYTDFSSHFSSTMAWDAAQCGNTGPPANNIEVILDSPVTIAPQGSATVAFLTTVWLEGGGQASGVYQACVYNDGGGSGTHAVIWVTNFTGSASGTVYWPYYGAVPTNVSGAGCGGLGCGSGAKIDLIVAHGAVVAASILGSDGLPAPISDKGIPRGTGYTVGDVLAIAPGNLCQGGACPGSVFPSHSSGTAMQITVGAVGVNTIAADGCTLATQNDISDKDGTNHCSFTDPGRTAGSYYATGGALGFGSGTWTPTANATFTGAVSSSVLTVSSPSGGPIQLGDAITWGSQTKQDYVKYGNGGSISALGTLTASACSLTPQGGCYNEIGTLGSVTSTTCSASPVGCANNTYTNVPLVDTGFGEGSNATATVVVSGGKVTTVTYNSGTSDVNYRPGDILTVDPTTVGGTTGGSVNFTVPVATLVGISGTQNGVSLLGGHGTEATGDVTVVNGTVTGITIHFHGENYLDNDVLYPMSSQIGGYFTNTGNPNASITISTFNTPSTPPLSTACNGSPCTGTGNNSGGTYALTGLNPTVSSGTMHSWTSLQLIQLMSANNKSRVGSVPGWITALTVPCVNKYINQGFGITSACP